MKVSFSPFWDHVKQMTATDDSVAVPETCVRAAVDLFQTRRRESTVRRFTLVPSFMGSVRRAEQNQKFLYKMDDQYMIHLEAAAEGDCFRLTGSFHGVDDGSVLLYGEGFVAESQVHAGQMEVEALPAGTYALLFNNDGNDYWVTDLTLGANRSL